MFIVGLIEDAGEGFDGFLPEDIPVNLCQQEYEEYWVMDVKTEDTLTVTELCEGLEDKQSPQEEEEEDEEDEQPPSSNAEVMQPLDVIMEESVP